MKLVDDFEQVSGVSETIYRGYVTLPVSFSTSWGWSAATAYMNSAALIVTSPWTADNTKLTILSGRKENGYYITYISVGH